ncbi:beta-glucosidase [Streptomyces lincolnensis]|uniref:Beta-glucosidase n=1 Tax=Streptomyces lincolnensis TaxID=1915 RepID=A0A1B1MNY0_STRLN|nr:beta-glucosidase [Streptomyces lincolnensis]
MPAVNVTADGLRFPDGFLWGASTAAHQIEGNNVNSDWWQTEHSGSSVAEPSLDAADSYHRWREDMDLLAELGFTDYRFSIEWARIEPAPSHFSRAEITLPHSLKGTGVPPSGAWSTGRANAACARWSPCTTSPSRAGSPSAAAGPRTERWICSSGTCGPPRRSSAPAYGTCAPSTNPTWSRSPAPSVSWAPKHLPRRDSSCPTRPPPML